ncbi:MAG: hypothetical protein KatS3mg023_2570 [Armatimonadota bacterium]|nr:MAG: hypothetical protein KatS3mg023_2570 [Armatimonadota bacterium]
MLVIKRLGWLSVGLVFGAMYVIFGLIAGVIFFILSLVNPENTAIGGLAALVLLPVLYGVLGFIGGILIAAVYNLIAPRLGGIRIETEPVDHL